MRFGAVLSCSLLLACAAGREATKEREAPAWNGSIRVHGALHAMFHMGKTGAVVQLDSLLPDPDLHAVGALADLAGEVTVVGGKAYLSYPDGVDRTRTEVTDRSSAGAALLVAADVPVWRTVTIERAIQFEEIDGAIAELARAAGMKTDRPFPFLLEGMFEDLQWHVIDGRRLPPGGAGHMDHLAASVREARDRSPAMLIGFYSENDEGVFTHMGSRTHIHCVVESPLSSGHVDHVTLPVGTRIRFPVERGGG